MISKHEKEDLSVVASDLLTGNYLLGRTRTEEQTRLRVEFCRAMLDAEGCRNLTDGQIALILEMSTMFYGGIDDMCEQLGVDPGRIKHAVL